MSKHHFIEFNGLNICKICMKNEVNSSKLCMNKIWRRIGEFCRNKNMGYHSVFRNLYKGGFKYLCRVEDKKIKHSFLCDIVHIGINNGDMNVFPNSKLKFTDVAKNIELSRIKSILEKSDPFLDIKKQDERNRIDMWYENLKISYDKNTDKDFATDTKENSEKLLHELEIHNLVQEIKFLNPGVFVEVNNNWIFFQLELIKNFPKILELHIMECKDGYMILGNSYNGNMQAVITTWIVGNETQKIEDLVVEFRKFFQNFLFLITTSYYQLFSQFKDTNVVFIKARNIVIDRETEKEYGLDDSKNIHSNDKVQGCNHVCSSTGFSNKINDENIFKKTYTNINTSLSEGNFNSEAMYRAEMHLDTMDTATNVISGEAIKTSGAKKQEYINSESGNNTTGAISKNSTGINSAYVEQNGKHINENELYHGVFDPESLKLNFPLNVISPSHALYPLLGINYTPINEYILNSIDGSISELIVEILENDMYRPNIVFPEFELSEYAEKFLKIRKMMFSSQISFIDSNNSVRILEEDGINTKTEVGKHKVVLDEFYCTCGKFQEFLIPCIHAMKEIERLGYDTLDYISDFYFGHKINEIVPITSKD